MKNAPSSRLGLTVNRIAVSLLVIVPSFFILWIWPDATKTPYVVVGLFAVIAFFAMPFFSWSGWKKRFYFAIELFMFIAALWLASFVLPPKEFGSLWRASFWSISVTIFYAALLLMLVKKFDRYDRWGLIPDPEFAQQTGQMQMATNGNENADQQEEDSPAKEFPARRPRFKYEDVRGMSELKDNLTKTAGHFKGEEGNGILLYGEPGNGKTFVAEALAGELGLNFLEARTQELTSRWIGHTTEKVKRIFEAAKAQAPCVLFLDEIDSFLLDRGGDMQQDARNTANTLLTAISELNKGYQQHGVLVVAATNFIDKLDGAGIREGRFDKKIEVYPPDMEARKGILMNGLDLPKSQLEKHEKLIEQVVSRWEGFSVARMRGILKMVNRFLRQGERELTHDVFGRALREVQGRMGYQLPEKTLRLNDLAFNWHQQEQIDVILGALKDRFYLESIGAKMPRGLLLFGPPGTGKTTIAKAIAIELGWAYISTSGQELLADPDKIDKLIRTAADIRPTIVFIDEAEGVIGDRLLNPHTKEITNKLLAIMDGDKPLHDVFFIAATNHPDDVDPAMVRTGRFSEHMDLTPDKSTLKQVAETFIEERSEHVDFVGEFEGFLDRVHEMEMGPSDINGCLDRAVRNSYLKQKKNGDSDSRITVELNGLP